jgi:leader peptidase (prepilin peptidase)/N-methyltransferase
MVFLLPPMLLAAAAWFLMTNQPWWNAAMKVSWVNGLMGAIFGALMGGFVIWIVRIVGTYAFGRLAMGLGDVHLMFGVGAVIGAAAVTVTFFIAPFFAILAAIYRLLFRKSREIPFGPYLSMATAVMLIFSCPILGYVRPGMMGLVLIVQEVIFRGYVQPL